MNIERPHYQHDDQGIYFSVANLTIRFNKVSEIDVLIAQLALIRAEMSVNAEE